MARRLYSALLNPGVRQAALRQSLFSFLLLLATFIPFANSSLANEAVSTKITGISWPVLPGESVERLAAQFFPNNNPMQQQFVSRTLELSRGQHPSLTSAQVFKQAAVVTIPDLKTLSIELNPDQADMESPASTATGLHLSYQLQNPGKAKPAPKTVESMVPPSMQAEYERLLKRDRDLQLASQNQDAHIANLEKVLEEVKPKVEAILAEDQAEAAEPGTDNVGSNPLIANRPDTSFVLWE